MIIEYLIMKLNVRSRFHLSQIPLSKFCTNCFCILHQLFMHLQTYFFPCFKSSILTAVILQHKLICINNKNMQETKTRSQKLNKLKLTSSSSVAELLSSGSFTKHFAINLLKSLDLTEQYMDKCA